MSKLKEDINDDEIVFLGEKRRHPAPHPRRKWWIILACLAAVAGISSYLMYGSAQDADAGQVEEVFEHGCAAAKRMEIEPLGSFCADSVTSRVERIGMTVNDIPLDIFIPHNCSARLAIGIPDVRDRSILLSLQAADIRADNKRINGAFVLRGQPLAWGLSKRGFVSIIRDTITVGVADNSPLFEKATETGGYFFRQYPLVDNGVLVESALRSKSIRKAICSRAGQTIVVATETAESMHDFAQALVDMGVDNAVYLVGSESAEGFYRSADGTAEVFAERQGRGKYRFENHIQWTVPSAR